MDNALDVSQGSVSKETLRTTATLEEMVEKGTNPAEMTVHQLAPFVVVGFGQFEKFKKYVPYIIAFCDKCAQLRRDAKKRWLQPVEGCYSLKEFFVNKCHRTPQAVYDQIRKIKEAEEAATLREPRKRDKLHKTNLRAVNEGQAREIDKLNAELTKQKAAVAKLEKKVGDEFHRGLKQGQRDAVKAQPKRDTAAITDVFYVLRRMTDGKFRCGTEWIESVQLAQHRSDSSWSNWQFDDVNNAEAEIVKVEAQYVLTAVKS